MRRRLLPVVPLSLVLLAVPSSPGAETPSVRPGTIVRWVGEGTEWCESGGTRFPPLDGACYFPVDLQRRAGPMAVSRGRGGKREARTLRVGAFDYPTQELTLPRRMVELSKEDLARVQRENRAMARLWSRDAERRFDLPLAAPLDPLPPGGRFGHRRIINGSPRSPHGGADFPAEAGTPVLAPADGDVALVADQFFGGKAVFLDHGDRLITMSMHLSRVDVAEGETVRRGQRVGLVGSTGRATGPHLHFGARWHGSRVDPSLLLGGPGAIPTIE